jgi:hypothetical protein
MKKMKKTKPRDPNIHLMIQLRRSAAAGSHQKSKKALRRQNKINLKKEAL